jgi:hypothetical protein
MASSSYVFRYDGYERYVTCDASPTMNRIVAMQKPVDDRRSRDDMALRCEDLVKYKVVNTTPEIWEIKPGVFEQLMVIEMEKADGNE